MFTCSFGLCECVCMWFFRFPATFRASRCRLVVISGDDDFCTNFHKMSRIIAGVCVCGLVLYSFASFLGLAKQNNQTIKLYNNSASVHAVFPNGL